ncbi:efflux RND transporter periplasmic adaptor subunit [Leeia sp. TBRC 13508]|uniref:Efflux RND transporter periplasmic adaptor subunit n=1 Tax=Leeia speluncae TaxID=2884804 RepID=A0ABS8D6L5_9NEIS|nr:efflux RND transporter periplasmic adaptor subunit [Leeia speluncae]MCB6183841.1 efflux RND transporter periplasmic adaptor subunit [Leeia speluncae]
MKKSLLTALFANVLLATAAMAGGTQASYTVQMKQVHQGIRLTASVQAVNTVQLSSDIQARVTDVLVNAGDKVKAGQLLVRLDNRVLQNGISISAGQLSAAKAQLKNAEANLQRTKQLVAQQFVSKASLDTAQSNYDAALATVQSLSGGVSQSVTQSSFSQLSAPFDGVVSETSVEKGTIAAPGVALMTLFDPSKLRAVAYVSQSVAEQLAKAGKVTWQVGSQPWQSGGVITVLPAADAVTHTREVRMLLPTSANVVPGQTIALWVMAEPVTKMVIPSKSVIHRGELALVNVRNQGKTERRMVRLGSDFGPEGVEVLAGLQIGDVVESLPNTKGNP